jgi:rhodanese-related sulfurtransferase
MINTIKQMFGFGPKVNYPQLMKNGAVIIDVRTKGEYQQGHINESQNIPLDMLPSHLTKLNKDTTIITCCASGMRSGQAKRMLQSNGFSSVYNGGGWNLLNNKIK